MWLIGRSRPEPTVELPLPLEIRPLRSARRMRLRIDEARGVLKLTCPWQTSRRTALAWAIEQRSWVECQLASAPQAEPFEPGALIPVEGIEMRLVADPAAPREVILAPGELRLGGLASGFARRVENHLRRRALDLFSAEVAEFAAIAGVRASGVGIGDATTRWGSCSSAGRIRLNWRLIMATPAVRRFVIAHEVAHLRHLNHGPQFRALESELVGPGLNLAKSRLREEGPRLRRLGLRRGR